MRSALLLAALMLMSCRDDRPPAPTEQQRDQLNDADEMLDSLANEEGPEANASSPSNSSDRR